MRDAIRDVATITFSGSRFDGGGVDFDVLPDLLAYRTLLIETAKELAEGEFAETGRLKFFPAESGAPVFFVKRIVRRRRRQEADPIDDAAQLIDETILAVSEERVVPWQMPSRVLRLLLTWGENLQEGESIKVRAARSIRTAEFTPETRRRLQRLLEPVVRDFIIRDAAPTFERHFTAAVDPAQPLWKSITDIGATLPPEEWAQIPTDFAAHLDRYLYGR